ncbi:probable methyltransferase PMT24 isoform X2 [Helianthus annuus]|nr:probable methyltransferase PMT24 isoform X2 [Helianthus annuus]
MKLRGRAAGIIVTWIEVHSSTQNENGFAAALRDLKVRVMNVVPLDSPDTLPIIYERGLFGIYHDWCESFNTYPRTYDLLHADHLLSGLKKSTLQGGFELPTRLSVAAADCIIALSVALAKKGMVSNPS